MNVSHTSVYTDIQCPSLTPYKIGKVRTVYDFGEQLLLVASDRVSAFDRILTDGIPQKASVLTDISMFWFSFFNDVVPHHFISADMTHFPKDAQQYQAILAGRSMLVKKTDVIPFECVVRGYIAGSGWKDYQRTGRICGHALPSGLQLADRLPEPIFTPATKSDIGDENISIDEMAHKIGRDTTEYLKATSLTLYEQARQYADTKGIIIADTKFEFGWLGDQILLIDEVLTPDSSRFWSKAHYRPGTSPDSYDKQIIRDYLSTLQWTDDIPPLPEHVIQTTVQKYNEIRSILISS